MPLESCCIVCVWRRRRGAVTFQVYGWCQTHVALHTIHRQYTCISKIKGECKNKGRVSPFRCESCNAYTKHWKAFQSGPTRTRHHHHYHQHHHHHNIKQKSVRTMVMPSLILRARSPSGWLKNWCRNIIAKSHVKHQLGHLPWYLFKVPWRAGSKSGGILLHVTTAAVMKTMIMHPGPLPFVRALSFPHRQESCCVSVNTRCLQVKCAVQMHMQALFGGTLVLKYESWGDSPSRHPPTTPSPRRPSTPRLLLLPLKGHTPTPL